MKKVKILTLLIVCGLFNVQVFGLGARRGTTTTTDAEERNVSEGKPVINRTLQRTSRQGRRPVATPPAQRRTTAPALGAKRQVSARGAKATSQAPKDVDVLVWNKLSDNQKIKFNELNTTFLKTVSTVSKNYSVWQKAIVEQAKMLIDINRLLVGYCVGVITTELEETAEERGVDALEKSNYIAGFLRQYASKRAKVTGTEREQFNSLMEDVSIDSRNLPAEEWINDVTNVSVNLIEKKELTMVQIRESLVDALKEAYELLSLSPDLIKVVDDIGKRIKDKELQSTPDYVSKTFQNLLRTLADTDNWNAAKRQPTEEWINNIIQTSKKMIVLFNTPLSEIKQQIGAQIYFVTVTKGGKFLNPQEQKTVVEFVDSIIEKIKS